MDNRRNHGTQSQSANSLDDMVKENSKDNGTGPNEEDEITEAIMQLKKQEAINSEGEKMEFQKGREVDNTQGIEEEDGIGAPMMEGTQLGLQSTHDRSWA